MQKRPAGLIFDEHQGKGAVAMWRRWERKLAHGGGRRAYRVAVLLVLVLQLVLAACGTPSTARHPGSTPTVPATATPRPTGWNTVASPGVGAEGEVTAVAALSASDVWAVGQFENLESVQQTLIEHWDGTQWTAVDSPSPSQRYNLLQGVAAISPRDAWAVGYSITAARVLQP